MLRPARSVSRTIVAKTISSNFKDKDPHMTGRGAMVPSMYLDFLNNELNPRITFTRASAGTYFGSDGLLKVQGYNLLTYSEDFTNGTSWSLNNMISTSEYIKETLNSGVHSMFAATGNRPFFNAGEQFALHAKISKKTDCQFVGVCVGAGTNGAYVILDVTTGVITKSSVKGTGYTLVSFNVINSYDEWVVKITGTTASASQVVVVSGESSGTPTVNESPYIGTGATIFINGLQLERSSIANEYSPTIANPNSGPRFDYDTNEPVDSGKRGPELARNGNFSQGLSEWSFGHTAPATVNVIGGVAVWDTTSGGTGRMRKFINTIPGNIYQVISKKSNVSMSIGTTNGGNDVSDFTVKDVIFFTARTATVYLNFISTTNGATLDNVSVTEVIAGTTGVEIMQTPFDVQVGYDNIITTQNGNSFSTTGGTTATRVYLNTIATIPGKRYKVSGRIVSLTSGNIQVYSRSGTNGNGTSITNTPSLIAGNPFSLEWTARTTQDCILIVGSGAGSSFAVDGLAIGELVFNPRGILIEESRTNLLRWSRDFMNAAWSKTDVTVAPAMGIDGVAGSADLITEGSAGTSALTQGVVVSAGATITVSGVFKRGNTDWLRIIAADFTLADGAQAWFNLATGSKGAISARGAGTNVSSTITSLGGGWYRCTVTATPNGTYTSCNWYSVSALGDNQTGRIPNATYTVDCAQLEVGAFATNIIPTTSAAVTRAADVAQILGSSFSEWYNQTQGTFVVEANRTVSLGYSGVTYMAHDNTALNRIYQANAFNVDIGGVLQVGYGYAGIQSGIPIKIADAYAVNDFASCANGGSVISDTVGNLPTVDRIRLGASVSSSTTTFLNGHIRRIAYYPTRLSNPQLQALTAP